MAGVIFDTTELIAAERAGQMNALLAGDDVAIAAITLAELQAGVVAAERRGVNRAVLEYQRGFLTEVARRFQVLPYTRQTAMEHAELLDHSHAAGKPRGRHDLIIAAHARETGRMIVSTDRKARFADLPGVRVRD